MSVLVPLVTGFSTFLGLGLVYTGVRARKPGLLDRRLLDEREQILAAGALGEAPIHPAPLDEHQVPLRVKGKALQLHFIHLPADRAGAPVLLLLHGHSSSIREFDDLYAHLAPHFEVFAFDQPNCGRSSDLAVGEVTATYRGAHPGLEVIHFLREVTQAFVEQVVLPRTGQRPVIVAGGSLGGNLGLFLAEARPRPRWLERVVVWSPASVWKHTWEKTIGARILHHRARKTWTRDAFLKAVFCDRLTPIHPPQPAYWYWDCWGHEAAECNGKGSGSCRLCVARPALDFPTHVYPLMGRRKVEAIERGYGTVKREFTPARAAWHWEVAAAQVGFSHFDRLAYAQIGCDVDFVAGVEDRHSVADIFGGTRELFRAAARSLRDTGLKIRGRWLEQTGHSVHHERPTALTKILLGEL